MLEFIGMVVLPAAWFLFGVFIGVSQERRRNAVVAANSASHNRQIMPCHCCGEPWDMSRNNACQCGAVLKQPGTA